MVGELKKQGIYDSTLIIISAKHGQSPIDISQAGWHRQRPAGNLINTLDSGEAFDISDDGSLIWLNDTSQTAEIAATLSEPANQATLGIQEIFAGQLAEE